MPNETRNQLWKPPKDVRVALHRGDRKAKQAYERSVEQHKLERWHERYLELQREAEARRK